MIRSGLKVYLTDKDEATVIRFLVDLSLKTSEPSHWHKIGAAYHALVDMGWDLYTTAYIDLLRIAREVGHEHGLPRPHDLKEKGKAEVLPPTKQFREYKTARAIRIDRRSARAEKVFAELGFDPDAYADRVFLSERRAHSEARTTEWHRRHNRKPNDDQPSLTDRVDALRRRIADLSPDNGIAPY